MPQPDGPENVSDASVGDLCHLVARLLDVERVSFWRRDDRGLDREVLFNGDAGGVVRATGRLRKRDLPDRLWRAGGELEVHAFSELKEPDSAYFETHAIYFQPVGVQSLLEVLLPGVSDDLCVLWVEHTAGGRVWEKEEKRVVRRLVSWWLRLQPQRLLVDEREELTSEVLRRLVADSSLGVFLTDGDQVWAANEALCTLLGVDEATAADGLPLRSFLAEDMVPTEPFANREEESASPRVVPVRRPDGTLRWGLMELAALSDSSRPGGSAGLAVGWLVDVTTLKDRAYSDPLTGLANRRLLEEQGERAVALAKRHDRRLALLFLDLSGFKRINDALGHRAGDEALIEVAARLRDQFRTSDVVARVGGDEYCVLLSEVSDPDGVMEAAGRLIDRLERPVSVGDTTIQIRGAVGVALLPDHANDFAGLLEAADGAMYRAKRTEHADVQMAGDNEWAAASAMAVQDGDGSDPVPGDELAFEADRLVLEYQPVFPARSATAVGAEALLRMRANGDRLRPAGEFIREVEERGEIGRFDRWVLGELISWQGERDPQWMAANISPRTVAESHWVHRLAAAYQSRPDDRNGAPIRLELPWPAERTGEATRGHDGDWLRKRLPELKEAGFAIFLELSSVDPEVLAEVETVRPDGVKVPQNLLKQLRQRTQSSADYILTWLKAIWETPLTVSRVDDPTFREGLEETSVDLYLQGRDLCPPVPRSKLPEVTRSMTSG